jgi:apolipoprotein N-acyltransferase
VPWKNRVALVKADCGYDSAIIDPYGRIIDRAIGSEPSLTVLIADVPLGRANALQTRLGDWVGWLSLAGMVFFIVFDAVTARRETGRKE